MNQQNKLNSINIDTCKNKFAHKAIGDIIMKELPIAYYNSHLYFYINGVYSDDISILERYIFNVDDSTKTRTINEIYNYIRIKKSSEQININPNYINFKNGLYDIHNKQLIPHNSNIFTINQINVNYVENPFINIHIEKFLDEITCNIKSRKETILQIIGYSFTCNFEFQKGFIFWGDTSGNGKSTLLEVINTLISSKNISHVSINNLQQGKFYAAELENKLLNTISELPNATLNNIDILKSIITCDKISVEKKYQNRYEIQPYSKHIFATNALPQVSDTNNSYYRRLNILKFDAQFSNEQKKAFNFSNLISSDALEYLAYLSLQSYLNLLETRTFANEKESEELINLYKIENNNVLEYLDYSENFLQILSSATSNKNRILKSNLHTSYIDFCQKHHYNSMGRNKFYAEILKTNLFSETLISGREYFQYLGPNN